jgi:uncharacterized membrane protein YfcA
MACRSRKLRNQPWGDINPFIAAPVAAGILLGAVGGSLILGRISNNKVRLAFVVVLLAISAQMLWKGVHTL